MISKKNWVLIWILGMAGQICWNIENSWFNTFVYNKIAPNPAIVSWMVAVSAILTTFCTFWVGTWSDRVGKRKPFIGFGYILWGLATIVFGLAEFLPKDPLWLAASFVVLADAVMSFFGSMGNDASFNPWTTDISDETNRGQLGGVLAVLPVFATIFGAIVSGMIIDKLDYFAFFIIMGVFVSSMGILSLIMLKDASNLKPRRDEKGFWHQFFSVFNWKTVKCNKELFWVFVIMCVYFIGFNVYFPYITIYFVNYLGVDYTTAGILQGVGLILAALFTLPAGKLINKNKNVLVIFVSLLSNTVGLFIIFLFKNTILLLLGILFTGIGYILILQTLTAWIKNLYPEDQRGQFEGIKVIFFVCIPMIIGPAIATPLINTFGLAMEIDGKAGMVPTPIIFLFSAILTLLTILPLSAAKKYMQKRLSNAKTN